MRSTLALCFTLTLVASMTACKYESPAVGRAAAPATATAPAQAAAAPATTQTSPALPPGHPAIGQLGAPAAAPVSIPAANLLTGKVAETMDAAGYTYIRLRGETGEIWAAVRQTKLSRGDIVTIAAQMTMREFESKVLKRKVDAIVFGTLAGPAGAPLTATAPLTAQPNVSTPPASSMAGMGGMTGGASKIEPGEIKVAKADGSDGRTVEEIWTNHVVLKDKQVVVRGKVVKFLPEIMGKNWIHLQDGSGSAENRTNDITVTTTDKAAAGDVVVVTGTIRTDVNLGAGYAYPVIIEHAKLKK